VAKKGGREIPFSSTAPSVLSGPIYRDLGKGERGSKSGGGTLTGLAKGREASGRGATVGVKGGAGSGYGRLNKTRAARKVPDKTES